MNVGKWVSYMTAVLLGLFIMPTITIIGLLFAGLYVFFKGKEDMDED